MAGALAKCGVTLQAGCLLLSTSATFPSYRSISVARGNELEALYKVLVS
jgi:hypothetical protein